MSLSDELNGVAAAKRRLEVAQLRREQLRGRRSELGVTLDQVGKASGLSQVKASMAEKGTESLDEDSYRRIATALGIPEGERIPNPDGPPDSMLNRPRRRNRPDPTRLA